MSHSLLIPTLENNTKVWPERWNSLFFTKQIPGKNNTPSPEFTAQVSV